MLRLTKKVKKTSKSFVFVVFAQFQLEIFKSYVESERIFLDACGMLKNTSRNCKIDEFHYLFVDKIIIESFTKTLMFELLRI